MPKIMPSLAKAEGYCCTYAFIRDNTQRASLEAKRLGVCKSTVLYWRKKVKEYECRCEHPESLKCYWKRY